MATSISRQAREPKCAERVEASALNRNIKRILYECSSRLKELKWAFRYLKNRITFMYENLNNQTVRLNDLPRPATWSAFASFTHFFVEIGSGHGELAKHIATCNHNILLGIEAQDEYSPFHVGFEIDKKYWRKSLKKIKNLDNVYLFHGDGYRETKQLFENKSVDGFFLLFPDPWHKKRHHKRRPITAEFARSAYKKLKPGGFILVATDWLEYFEFIDAEFGQVTDLFTHEKGIYSPEKLGLVPTHYYKKWLEMGREFNYHLLKKK